MQSSGMKSLLEPAIVRPASPADINAISEMVSEANPGITTLPRDSAQVVEYVVRTEATLCGDTSANQILFVLDLNGSILGIAGLIPRLGTERAFYSFEKRLQTKYNATTGLASRYELLSLSRVYEGYSELATLFLSKKARGSGLARLLSLARLAFVSSHRDLFSNRLMADIRGWVDEDGQSPFWREVSSKFIDMSFDEADRYSAGSTDFINDLFPDAPILLSLLPEEALSAIGVPHDHSARAYHMLGSVGFHQTGKFDVFDAGPSIECKTEDVVTIKAARRPVTIEDGLQETVLYSRGKNNMFRAAIAPGNLEQRAASAQALDALNPSSLSDLKMAPMRIAQG